MTARYSGPGSDARPLGIEFAAAVVQVCDDTASVWRSRARVLQYHVLTERNMMSHADVIQILNTCQQKELALSMDSRYMFDNPDAAVWDPRSRRYKFDLSLLKQSVANKRICYANPSTIQPPASYFALRE